MTKSTRVYAVQRVRGGRYLGLFPGPYDVMEMYWHKHIARSHLFASEAEARPWVAKSPFRGEPSRIVAFDLVPVEVEDNG